MSGPDGNWRRSFQLHQRCIGPTGSYAMSLWVISGHLHCNGPCLRYPQ